MRSLVFLRVIYGCAVLYGVWAAANTLLEVRRIYKAICEGPKNGPAPIFLAHSHVTDAWQTLYIQIALLVILILGSFIPIHPWHEEGAVARGWITVFHTSLTIVSTWKSIRVRRDRKILADMVGMEV